MNLNPFCVFLVLISIGIKSLVFGIEQYNPSFAEFGSRIFANGSRNAPPLFPLGYWQILPLRPLKNEQLDDDPIVSYKEKDITCPPSHFICDGNCLSIFQLCAYDTNCGNLKSEKCGGEANIFLRYMRSSTAEQPDNSGRSSNFNIWLTILIAAMAAALLS